MEESLQTSSHFHFLKGGGEMGALTRAYNWSNTSLGSPDTWPQSLRTLVNVILNSRFPMFLWWGKELIQFYNDAYRPSLGKDGKHPHALGKKGIDTWSEIWPVIKPLIDRVLAGGGATWSEDQLIPIYRNGTLEDVYWTFSYSPVMDDTGNIAGVLVTCTETTDKVLSMKKLQESEDRLRFALNAGDLGAWQLDLATMSFEASDLFKINFGQPIDEPFTYETLQKKIHPSDLQRTIDALTLVITSGEDYDLEFRIIWADRSIHWVHLKGKLRYDDCGIPMDMVGVSIDITERKKVEKTLLESEQRFKNLVHQASVGIVVLIGEEMKISIVNEAYANLIGRTSEELIDKNLFEVIPEVEAYFRPINESVRTTGEPLYLNNIPYTVTSGVTTISGFLNLIYQPYREVDDTISGIIVLCQDITDQVLAQKQIEESETRFRALIEEAPIATSLYVGRELKIELANDAMIALWGKGAYVIGMHLDKALPELEGQPFLEILNHIFDTGESYEAKSAPADLVVNGVLCTYYFDYTYKPLFNSAGEVYGIMNMAVDVTEQVLAQKRIIASEARFRALIAEAPIATIVFRSRDLIIELANEPTVTMWGKGSEIIGKRLAEVLKGPKSVAFLKLLDDVFTTGKTLEINAVPITIATYKGDVTYYFDCTYKALHNSDNVVESILGMGVDVTEQVLARQRIEESQKELHTSFEQAPVAIATISEENLTFRIINPFYAELVGRRVEDLVNKPLMEALPELAGQGFDDLLRGVISSGQAYVAKEVSVELNRNGKMETIYVDLTYQPRREDDSERINGVLVVAIDVTQQVLSRKSIEESEAKLRTIIESAPAAIGLFMGKDLVIENPNQTFIDIVGKGSGIIGKPLREAMPELENENQPFIQILEEVYATGKQFDIFGTQAKILRADGTWTNNYYNITYSPIFNSERKVYAILQISIEVTDQIKAQKALEEAEAELRSAIEVAGLATWSLDINKGVFSYSPRFMEWLGFSENTKSLDEAYNPLPGEFRESVPAAIAATILPGASGFYQNEHPIINRLTGQTRIIHAQGQVFYDTTGAPMVLKGIAQDITLQREMQLALEAKVLQRTEELKVINKALSETNKQLLHSNEELAQFAYIASHDLQEPLRKISTFSELLERNLETGNKDKILNHLHKIKSSSNRMANLIRDVLQYSKLVRQNESFEIVDLNKILLDIIAEYDLLIEQKHAVILNDALPFIEAIPLQMAQLFRNLLSNALKYTRPEINPSIVISVSSVSALDIKNHLLDPNLEYYHFKFSDNGIGFGQEHAEKVFTIFQRLHLKSEYEGTGIGLAMCKKIALNHHGDIDAQGSSEEGAIFNFWLPKQQFPTR